MARLPTPGSDDGIWGQVLNVFLTVSHNNDGTVKAGAIDSTTLQDNSITNAKLNTGSGSDGQVLTKDSATTSGIKWSSVATASDATTSTKGIVQLAGDLGGTASSPTVPGLAGKINSSIVDAKGDILVATAADTVARLAIGNDGQVLTADSTQTTGIKWATPSSGLSSGQVYPLEEGYGYHSASIHPDDVTGASSIAAWHTRIWVPADKAISTAAVIVTAAANGTATLAGFAVYTDDGQTKLGETTFDNNLFLSTGYRQATFSSPIAAEGSGRFVRVLFSNNYSISGPSCAFATDDGPINGIAYNGGLAIRTAYFSALTSFPASFNPSTGSGLSGWTQTNFLPIILLG